MHTPTNSVKGSFIIILMIMVLMNFVPVANFLRVERKHAVTVTDRTLSNALKLQVSYIDLWFREKLEDIKGISSLNSVQNRDIERMTKNFKVFAETKTDLDAIVYVDKRGRPTAASAERYKGKLNLSDRTYFKEAQKGRQYVTPVLIGRSTGKSIIIFSTPLFKKGKFDGLIFSSVSLDQIADLILNHHFDKNGQFKLFDENGRSIMPDKDRLHSLKLSSRRYFTSTDFKNKDTILKLNNSKDGTIIYISPLHYSNIYVGGSLNFDEIMRYSHNMIKTTLIGMFLFTTTGLLLFWLFFIKISTSLQVLDRNLLSISKGTYSLCPPEDLKHLPAEIRKIALAIETLKKKVKMAIDKINEQATKDTLTKLNNRFFFEQSLQKLMSVNSDPVTIMICDVNGLKLINDALGHCWGDLLLKRTAEVLKNTSVLGDIVARIGGDEFAIIRPKSTLKSEQDLSKKLEEELEKIKEKTPFIKVGVKPLALAMGI